MCGRFTLRTPASAVIENMGLSPSASRHLDLFRPRFNIAPTQDVWTVRVDLQGNREMGPVRWGLIPSWTKDLSKSRPLINARSETVAEKPSFRAAFRRRRCLIPADGFYEWKTEGGKKQPYYIRLDTDRLRRGFRGDADANWTPPLFAIAGLWEAWEGGYQGTRRLIESCTLLTTAANRQMVAIHDRMPVILSPADYALWLDPKVDESTRLTPLLRPLEDDLLLISRVSDRVNRTTNDDAACMEEFG